MVSAKLRVAVVVVLASCASSLLVTPRGVKVQSASSLEGWSGRVQARHGARLSRGVVIGQASLDLRGGVTQSVTLSSLWGVTGVLAMLLNAVKRVLPVAMEPFQNGLSLPLWSAYAFFALGMCYVEGYKAFHKKFSPMVVARSMTLSQPGPLFHSLLAPIYAMGLFHATPKRCKTSWGFVIGIFALVKLVKKLDYPWRSIVDGGVVVGLTVGSVSIVYHYIRALRGVPPPVDPNLP